MRIVTSSAIHYPVRLVINNAEISLLPIDRISKSLAPLDGIQNGKPQKTKCLICLIKINRHCALHYDPINSNSPQMTKIHKVQGHLTSTPLCVHFPHWQSARAHECANLRANRPRAAFKQFAARTRATILVINSTGIEAQYIILGARMHGHCTRACTLIVWGTCARYCVYVSPHCAT